MMRERNKLEDDYFVESSFLIPIKTIISHTYMQKHICSKKQE